jgi:hypothetical protein
MSAVSFYGMFVAFEELAKRIVMYGSYSAIHYAPFII